MVQRTSFLISLKQQGDVKLLYKEHYSDKHKAAIREKQVKRYSREKKQELIAKFSRRVYAEEHSDEVSPTRGVLRLASLAQYEFRADRVFFKKQGEVPRVSEGRSFVKNYNAGPYRYLCCSGTGRRKYTDNRQRRYSLRLRGLNCH